MTYLERQKSYGQYNFHKLFDLGVKSQGQMNVMVVMDTQSIGNAPTFQILSTYLERQKSYGRDKRNPLFYLYLTLRSQLKLNLKLRLVKFAALYACYQTCIVLECWLNTT